MVEEVVVVVVVEFSADAAGVTIIDLRACTLQLCFRVRTFSAGQRVASRSPCRHWGSQFCRFPMFCDDPYKLEIAIGVRADTG